MGEPANRLTFRSWLVSHAFLALLVFVLGVVIYAIYASTLENRFAETARSEHLGLFALTNLRLLPSYAVIALYHALLTFVPARRFYRTRDPRRFGWRAWHAFWMSAFVLLLSMGPLTYLSTGPIDTLARITVHAYPSIDLYGFFEAHVREILTTVYAAFALVALAFLATRAMRAVVAIARAPRVRLVATAVLALGITNAVLRTSRGAVHASSSKLPHVILIASDSLRADHLSLHGYPRAVSPHIDALAKESIDFEKCHVATASTLESWTSFLTGQYPANHGLRYMFVSREQVAQVSSNPNTLPRLLAKSGYRTSVFGDWAANCFDVVDFGFQKERVSKSQNLDVFMAEIALRTHPLVPLYLGSPYFEKIVPNLRQAVSAVTPNKIVSEFVSEIEDADREGQPAFSVLFLSCTHLPFMSPYPWNKKFADPDYRGPNRYRIDFAIDDFIQHGFAEAQSKEERQHVVDLYDGGVAWFDSIVGEVVDRLREDGILDDSIVVIASDHGDDLYEPGLTLGHGTNFFGGDQSTHIPLVVRLPKGDRGGTRVKSLVRGIDLKSTLLDLVGVAANDSSAPHSCDGTSLRPLMFGTTRTLDLPAFGETCYLFFPKKPLATKDDVAEVLRPADETLFIDTSFDNQLVLKPEWHDAILRTKDRMLRTERWKLVYVAGMKGPIWRLYDMPKDPHEQHDLSEDPSVAPVFVRLKKQLLDWIATGRDARWTALDDEIDSANDR